MEDMKYIVYCHTLKKDGRSYIGITKNKPKVRWNYGNGYKNNQYFFRTIKKYGWDAFEHKILFSNLTSKQASDLEILLIGLFKTSDKNYGFNITMGGDKGILGYHFSEESKRIMSLKKKGRKLSPETIAKMRIANIGKGGYFKGKKLTKEHREAISNGLRGHKISDEVKQKISIANKGKSHRVGYHHSEETKRKISLSNKMVIRKPETEEHRMKIALALKNHPKKSKKIYCLETDTIYPSIHEANRILNVDYSNISACCRGVYKQTHGYHFSYVESEV